MSDGPGYVERIRRNIRLNYAYTALLYTGFDKGIWMLFLGYRGLGLVEIGLVESTYQLASLVFGIPAGAIADLLGRKVSLVLSVVARIMGYSLILLSHGMVGFAAGFTLNAISQVLYAGASESLTYDSCKIAGLSSYKKVYGNILAVTFIATALGIAAGGIIAGASFEWVYYATIITLLCALLPAAMFTETHRQEGRRPRVRDLLSRSVRLITGNPLILYLLVLSAAITTIDMTIYMYCQRYFQAMSIPVSLIGAIFCFDSICAALGARYAYVFERFRNRDVIALIPGVIFAMYVLLALIGSPVVVPLLWVATVFVVGFWPILSDLINARVPSENRATVLSLKAQLSSFGVMIVFPAVGLIAAATSLSTAFLGLLIAAIPLTIYCVVKIRKIAF